MKQLLIITLSGLFISPVISTFYETEKHEPSINKINPVEKKTNGHSISFGLEPGQEKMLAVVFKKQDYCRLELKDFEFEPIFELVSATVYFSGTNFSNSEKGYITSTSLKPIKPLMQRCAPGSFVIFDNVKIIGPDKMLRSIPGMSIVLH